MSVRHATVCTRFAVAFVEQLFHATLFCSLLIAQVGETFDEVNADNEVLANMQRAEVMVGMTWIFRIRQRLLSPLHWKELEACYFPSCVHVLTETKQDEQTINEKMEQQDRQMQALLNKSEDETMNKKMEQLDRQIKMQALLMQTLLKKSDDGQKKNDDVDKKEQSDLQLRNNFTRSSTDEEVYQPNVSGALNMADLATEQTVTEAAQTFEAIKYIEAAAANDAVAAAEKRTADVVKQINVMNSTMKDTQYARLGAEKEATEMAKQIEVMQAEAARLAAENQATEMAEQIMQDEAARLAAQKQADEMAKQIGAMQAEAARLAAEKKATKPKETFF